MKPRVMNKHSCDYLTLLTWLLLRMCRACSVDSGADRVLTLPAGVKSQSSISTAGESALACALCSTGSMAQYSRISGSVALITLQNPPVNALRWAELRFLNMHASHVVMFSNECLAEGHHTARMCWCVLCKHWRCDNYKHAHKWKVKR